MSTNRISKIGLTVRPVIDGGHFVWEEAAAEYASTVLDMISTSIR